jgi:hypothetical protein
VTVLFQRRHVTPASRAPLSVASQNGIGLVPMTVSISDNYS